MKIKFHRKFEKQYKKLPDPIKKKTKEVIKIFADNPKHSSLKNHPLKGQMTGLRSISVTGDIRIVFQKEEDYLVVIFLSIGGHNKV